MSESMIILLMYANTAGNCASSKFAIKEIANRVRLPADIMPMILKETVIFFASSRAFLKESEKEYLISRVQSAISKFYRLCQYGCQDDVYPPKSARVLAVYVSMRVAIR